VVVAERIAIIVPSVPPARHARQQDAALPIVRSDGAVVEVVTQASCAAGSAGLPKYAAAQAWSALRIARYSLIDPPTVAGRLWACIQRWPASNWRDTVARWVAK
jgi:hypothetical protein